MQERPDSRIKKDLLAEINALEEHYGTLKRFIAGEDLDILELGSTLKLFKDGLSRASAFVLALYNLQSQRVKIPWEPLFTSLDYAIATIDVTESGKQLSSIRAVLSMSYSQLEQVMVYLAHLKDSLKI